MLIFKNPVLLFSDSFHRHLVNSINTSNVTYFKSLIKNTRNPKRVKTLDTIKLLNKIQSEVKREDTQYVPLGKSMFNLDALPKPKILYAIKICKNKPNQEEEPNERPYWAYSRLMKSLLGFKIKSTDIKRSYIVKQIREMYPIELRNVLFAFSMKYMDSMDESDLDHLQSVLKIHSENDQNSTLLEYLSGKTHPQSGLMENNPIFVKLLRFVSSTHPSLPNH